MDLMLPVEVIRCGTKEIQMSLLSNRYEDRELMKVLMISYTLIKFFNTGLYGKSIEHWNNLPAAD